MTSKTVPDARHYPTYCHARPDALEEAVAGYRADLTRRGVLTPAQVALAAAGYQAGLTEGSAVEHHRHVWGEDAS